MKSNLIAYTPKYPEGTTSIPLMLAEYLHHAVEEKEVDEKTILDRLSEFIVLTQVNRRLPQELFDEMRRDTCEAVDIKDEV